MNKISSHVCFLTLLLLLGIASQSPAQSVAINTDGSTANESAILDIKSINKGLLVPRMNQSQRDAIASPATGLMIFQTDNTPGYYYYNGIVWTQMSSGSGSNYWSLNGSHIFNTNGGNVGIGTNTPSYPITIQTPINSTGWAHVGGADSIIIGEAIGGLSAVFGTFTNHVFRLVAGPGQGKMSIYPTGEVVVGDNSAGSFGKFTVHTLNNSYGISQLGEGGNILATIIGGTSAGIGTFSPTNMRIFSGGLSRVFISQATGNVGIGTDNPTYKLSVLGNVRCTEAVVETGWADYVFDEKYKLRSLEDVEKFIQQNKHLPNIPSAKEVSENGLHLGDTQKKMMEKIEELTLYLIEASKRIEKLEQLLKVKNQGHSTTQYFSNEL